MQEQTVINQVWAWLFANGKTHRHSVVKGQVIESGLERDEVEDITRSFLGVVVDRIATAHDWDFVCDEASTTSVISTTEYILRGNNDDCRDIINVRYGSGRGTVIERLNTLQTDRREGESEAGVSDTEKVYGYTVYGRSDDGFPQIKLFDSPASAETITYRYRKKDISLSVIPDEFGYVVRDMVLANFDSKYLGVAERRLGEMVNRYTVGGDEYETARMHPTIEAGNIRRRNNMGGC